MSCCFLFVCLFVFIFFKKFISVFDDFGSGLLLFPTCLLFCCKYFEVLSGFVLILKMLIHFANESVIG